MLKLKASWGQQGNDAIGDYRYTDTYYLSNFNGEVSFVQNTVGNPNITWETNSNFNAGIEFVLLKSLITGSIEYFSRKTTDMLCFVYVPFSGGYTGSYDNVGDMVNRGVEVDLHFTPIRTKDLSWMINLNATHYKNKITMLNDDNKGSMLDGHPGYVSDPYFYGEGLPMHTFRLKKYAGVTADGESSWYVKDEATGEADHHHIQLYGILFQLRYTRPRPLWRFQQQPGIQGLRLLHHLQLQSGRQGHRLRLQGIDG